MQVDLFTFSCQILNFLILLFLLKRFLYRPVFEAMDARQQRIAEAQTAALHQRAEAEQEAAAFRKKKSDLDARRQELIASAEQEAEGRRKELLHQARAEVSRQQDGWRESLRQEKESFLGDLRERSSRQIWLLARKTLADLAGIELEEQIARVFVQRLAALPAQERNTLAADLRAGGGEVTVESAFDLPEDVRSMIEEAAAEHLEPGLTLRFCTSPETVAGIELKTPGQKIAWSIGDYLQTLEERVASEIEDELARPGEGGAKAARAATPGASAKAEAGPSSEADESAAEGTAS